MVNKIRNGIVWIRTPKCATSTLAVHFENFCKWRGMKYTLNTEHNSMPPSNFFNLGHLWGGNVNWDVVKRENRGVISSIRNPLDRFLSHYKHHLRDGRHNQYKNDVSSYYLGNYKLEHFEDSFRGMDNYLCKYLSVGNDEGWNVELLNEKYDLIFVSEYLSDGLQRFEKMTGYSFENKDSVYNKTETNLIITDEFIDKFKENNKNDYELYNYVLEKYGYR